MKKKYEQHGLGFIEALGLLFITLRLCGVISWPWIWVLAPVWGQLVIFLVFMVGYVLWEDRKWK